MTAQTDLTDLINVLRKGTPEELGKAWRERAKLYKKSPAKEFDDFVRSNKSYLEDIAIFDGKLEDLDSK